MKLGGFLKKTLVLTSLFLVVATLPTISAYEAHVINIRARICSGEVDFNKYYEGPSSVPIKTYQEWTLIFVITNGTPSPMTDITVKDTIPAQFDVSLISKEPAGSTYTQVPSGGPKSSTKITWHIDTLNSCETAILKLKLSTRVNPGGVQEFSSAGTYNLNEGAKLTWTFNGVDYLSKTTGHLEVTAYVP